MSGNDLRDILQAHNVSAADVAAACGWSRVWVHKLLRRGSEALPDETVAKLRAGLLQHSKRLADAFFGLAEESDAA